MALFSRVSAIFGTADLYDVLKVAKDADDSALKRAYYKMALSCHPDKVPPAEKPEAEQKFQVLCAVHQLLADPRRRRVYDRTGEVDDVLPSGLEGGDDWYAYWRARFEEISTQMLDVDKRTYQGSVEEDQDLKTAYLTSKGDIAKILDLVVHCSVLDDEARFRTKIGAWIATGELPSLPAFVNEPTAKATARRRRAEAEAKEAQEALAALHAGSKCAAAAPGAGVDGLAALILSRNATRVAQTVARQESKHSPKEGTSVKKRKAAAEPTEEEFQAIQARLMEKRNKVQS